MPKNYKIIDILIKIFNVLSIICYICTIIIRKKLMYSLYWIITPMFMTILIYLVWLWSKLGKNSDIDKSQKVQRSFDDITAVATMFYAAVYLVIMFFDCFNEGIKNNVYLITVFFIITIVYELISYLAINNAKRETLELLNKQHSTNKK